METTTTKRDDVEPTREPDRDAIQRRPTSCDDTPPPQRTGESGAPVAREAPRRRRGEGRVLRHPLTGGWYVALYYRGREMRLSAAKLLGKPPQSVTEQDAWRALRRQRKKIAGDRYCGPQAERVTVKELVQDYRRHLELRNGTGLQGNQAKFDRVEADLGEIRAAELNTPAIERWTASLLEADYAPGTVDTTLGCLRSALNYARKSDRLAGVPYIPMLHPDNTRRVFFEREEVGCLIALLPAPLDDAVRFAFLTGWRHEEVFGLSWAWIDRAGGVITLPRSKNGYGRTVPLVGDLAALIDKLWEARKPGPLCEWVFHRKGKPVRWIAGPWRLACAQAGITGKVLHDFRRTAVRDMIRAGVSETVAMTISGHRSRSVFDRYNITSERDREQALLRTDAYRAVREAVVVAISGRPS